MSLWNGHRKSPSLPSRERGLKLYDPGEIVSLHFVAPFAGAWIETRSYGTHMSTEKLSLPSRERGLKHEPIIDEETFNRRSLRGSVD